MATIDQSIIGVSPTAYGIYLQTVKKLGLPFSLIENTTLNEKFNVQSGVAPAPGIYPHMRYLGIGNLGHLTVKADDNSDETVPIPHRASNAAPYNMIPMVLREVDNDLPSNRRQHYRLRVQEVHDGRNYFAYYLRHIDMTDVVVQLQQMEIDADGNIITTPFIPTTDNLNPRRPEISNTGAVLGSDSSVSASAVLTIRLNADDVAEIVNAHRIRTGSPRSPVISELALCSGVDREVAGPSGGGGTFTYTEVIAAQVNAFISTNHPVGYSSDGMRFTLDVGGVEPLIGEDDVINASFL